METNLSHVSQVPRSAGAYRNVANPIKPELFAGTYEARLGRTVGMTQFGVNLVTLDPGCATSLRHWHEAEDEFVYVFAGEPTLIDENGAHPLRPGSIAGFPANRANAHHVVN